MKELGPVSPGPWRVWRGKAKCEVRDARDVLVAELADVGDDARVIADAPEMLAMLRTLALHEHRWPTSDDWCSELLPKLMELVNRHGGVL